MATLSQLISPKSGSPSKKEIGIHLLWFAFGMVMVKILFSLLGHFVANKYALVILVIGILYAWQTTITRIKFTAIERRENLRNLDDIVRAYVENVVRDYHAVRDIRFLTRTQRWYYRRNLNQLEAVLRGDLDVTSLPRNFDQDAASDLKKFHQRIAEKAKNKATQDAAKKAKREAIRKAKKALKAAKKAKPQPSVPPQS